jgi:hypothetical protein
MRSKTTTTSAIRRTLILLASAILAIGLAAAQSSPASTPSQPNQSAQTAPTSSPSQPSGANGVNPNDNNGAAANPSQNPTANPNAPANTDQNGNPTAAHRTDSRSWLWILLGVIVIALIVRYISRGRARPGTTGSSTNRPGRKDPNDIRRAG